MRYTVVYLPGLLNESGVAMYVVVDKDPEASVGVAMARATDSTAALAIAAALNGT
jgi:hypothetical protein